MDENWLNDILKEQYTLVKVLKRTDTCQITLLRHKKLGKELIKRVDNGSLEVYQLLAKFKHPNIVYIYDVQKQDDQITVLEEYVQGRTIVEVLECGLYHPKGVRQVIASLCDALDTLHKKRIIHRDIKPENIIISDSGIVKLIDFNAAKLYKPYHSSDTAILGTTGFAAPEQYGFSQSDERVDIYAIGVLMNIMLTGYHPSNNLYAGEVGAIIQKCLQINPDMRFQSATELKENLDYCAGST